MPDERPLGPSGFGGLSLLRHVPGPSPLLQRRVPPEAAAGPLTTCPVTLPKWPFTLPDVVDRSARRGTLRGASGRAMLGGEGGPREMRMRAMR